MTARDNNKFDRIITMTCDEKCNLIGALNHLFEKDGYYTLPEEDRINISELWNMLNY